MSARTKLVVGLGNPGRQYEGTRHNVGFAVVDRAREKLDCVVQKRGRFLAGLAGVEMWTPLGMREPMLARPATYMNRSGTEVSALLRFYKIQPDEMLVIVDDVDLPLGQIRLRASGGSGGHNGLRSIIEALGGDENFARLRVGIGRSGAPGEDITDHVLSLFGPNEHALADNAMAEAAEAVLCCVKEGLTTAMNRFNRRIPPEAGREGEPC